jgi:hypothetical protein
MTAARAVVAVSLMCHAEGCGGRVVVRSSGSGGVSTPMNENEPDRGVALRELIGATGDTDSFELSLQVQKQDGSWYVAGMDMSV